MTDNYPDDIPADDIPAGYQSTNWHHGFAGLIGPFYEKNADDGKFLRAFKVGKQHINGKGSCHGGMLTAFADNSFGHIISIEENRHWVTVRLLTDFLAGAQLGDWVESTSRIVGHNGSLYTVEGRMWVGAQTILTGTGVFKALGSRG